MHYLDRCAECVAHGGVVDKTYLDFAKGFDTVPNHRLLRNLKLYGIEGEVLQWIEAFLSHRVQEVVVNWMSLIQS